MKKPRGMVNHWGTRERNYTQEVGVNEIRGLDHGGVGCAKAARDWDLIIDIILSLQTNNTILDCSFFIYGGLIFLSKPRYVNR